MNNCLNVLLLGGSTMKHYVSRILAVFLALILIICVTGSVYADPVYTVDATGYDSSSGTFTAFLYGVENTSQISSVQFPVWSKADQSDIIWYTASLNADGSYSTTVRLKNHAYNVGIYTVHCYVNFKSGSTQLVGADTIEISASAGVFSVYNSDGNVYAILEGLTIPGVTAVKFPVWSQTNGQDDIIWYSGSKQSDGSYIAFIDPSRHKDLGVFSAHCYVTKSNGTQELVGGTNFTVSESRGSVSAEPGDTAGVYLVRLSGAVYSGGIQSVRFPVWSDVNGQDDLVWYNGVKQADGSYTATVRYSNHKNFGQYIAHCYVTTNSGSQILASGTTFTVDEPTTGILSVTSNGDDIGSFHVSFIPSGNYAAVSKVQFPVWCSSDQSDIVWYTAARQYDGSFTCDVNYASHKCHTGKYTIHAYVTDLNGKRTLVTGTNFDLTVSSTNTITVTPLDTDGTRVLVTITNAVSSGTISSMYFPTWSSANGQDDILWYRASNIGGNTWQATISLSNHSSSGKFITHAYANGNVLLGGVDYELNGSSDASMNNRIVGKYSATPYLVAVDTTSNTVGIYQGSAGNWNLVQHWSCTTGKASSPTITGEFTIGSKGTSFSGSNYTCWYYTQFCGNYLFHSVLYERGSQTDVRVGTLGANLSDGCVRLAIENARWLQQNVPAGSKVVIY